MHCSARPVRRSLLAFAGIVLIAALGTPAVSSVEDSFMHQAYTAMMTMMNAMEVKSSGDADVDFVAMMAAHQQGAIDMARAQLRYGRNEELRRLAQEIIVQRQQQIAAMRIAIGQAGRP